jgi:hypothetical protein
MGKLLTGVFMAVTVLSPVISWRIPNLEVYTSRFQENAAEAVAMGQCASYDAVAGIIKEQCEAYILDKAREFGADISVVVILSADTLPVPQQVQISGEWAPYAKLRLTEIISQDLGIDRGAQIWKS